MEKIVCPMCNGEGECEYEVPIVDYLHGGELGVKVMQCTLCDGYGELEDEEE